MYNNKKHVLSRPQRHGGGGGDSRKHNVSAPVKRFVNEQGFRIQEYNLCYRLILICQFAEVFGYYLVFDYFLCFFTCRGFLTFVANALKWVMIALGIILYLWITQYLY